MKDQFKHKLAAAWRITPKPVLVLLVGGLVIAGLLTLKPAPTTMPPREPPPPQVTVVHAEPRDQSLTVESQGTVAPRHEIDLVAQVAGRVTEVDENFVEGGFFQKGEVLLQVDPRDYELALVRAEARVAEAQQVLAQEKAQARQAEREWRDLGSEEANELFLRKPQLAAVRAQLEAAKAERDQAELDLERTKVRAPFDGRVREASADIGQYVSPGTPVGRVYGTAVAVVRLPLTDAKAALIDLPLGFRGNEDNPGPAVTIKGTVAGDQYQWQGHIVRTDASVDTETRLYYAVAEVKDPFAQHPDENRVPLVVGLFVSADISGKQIANVIKLPREALFKNNQVYTLDDSNKVQLKVVRVLKTDQDHAWVKGELVDNEPVVVGGQSFLVPDMEVAPQPSSEVAAAASK